MKTPCKALFLILVCFSAQISLAAPPPGWISKPASKTTEISRTFTIPADRPYGEAFFTAFFDRDYVSPEAAEFRISIYIRDLNKGTTAYNANFHCYITPVFGDWFVECLGPGDYEVTFMTDEPYYMAFEPWHQDHWYDVEWFYEGYEEDQVEYYLPLHEL